MQSLNHPRKLHAFQSTASMDTTAHNRTNFSHKTLFHVFHPCTTYDEPLCN